MNEKEIRHFARVLDARVREAQGSGRPPSAATRGASARDSAPRWKDGTLRDPEAAILEEFDEERYAVDSEYQGRPEIKRLAERLVAIRERKRQETPVQSPKGAPSQEEYEKDRAGILRRERIGQADAAIEEAKARRAILDLDAE